MSYQPPTKIPREMFCPSCRGGNPYQARHCLWCGKPMGPVVKQKSGPSWLLIIGVWLAFFCVLGYAAQAVVRTTGVTTFTTADRRYLSASAEWSKEYSARMNKLTILLRNVNFGDQDWKLDVAVQGAQIKSLNKKVRAYDAPSKMGGIHSKLVQSANLYDRAMDNYIKALDTRDKSWFARGDAELEKAIPLMIQAMHDLEALDD
jgi:hypothetical protein